MANALNDEYKKEIFLKINELLGNKDNGYVNGRTGSMIGKKIKESTLTIEEIRECILGYEQYIKDFFISKNCHSEFSKLSAIFTIINDIKLTVTYGGCYEIKNIDTNGIYIGETVDLFRRMNEHVSMLYSGKHHCKSLQDAFNIHKDFSHFKFTPLFLYEINGEDRESEKCKTLYMEAAYFLKYTNKGIEVYNTVDPYATLKENKSASVYNIDNKKVLKLLLNDELNILPSKVKEIIDKDLKDFSL